MARLQFPILKERESSPIVPSTPSQLLILDLKIPRVDGFEVLRWLRQQPDLNAVGVLVLTSSQDMRDVNLAYQLGANSFLHKPVRTECFLNTIMTMNVAIGFGPAQLPPLPVSIRRNGSPAGELERVAIFSAFS